MSWNCHKSTTSGKENCLRYVTLRLAQQRSSSASVELIFMTRAAFEGAKSLAKSLCMSNYSLQAGKRAEKASFSHANTLSEMTKKTLSVSVTRFMRRDHIAKIATSSPPGLIINERKKTSDQTFFHFSYFFRRKIKRVSHD